MAATSKEAAKRAEERRNYQKLERRLVLLSWLLGKFGFSENKELLEFTAQADEGFDSEGRAYVESIPESWILPGWEIQIFYFLKNPAASFQIFD